VQVLLPRHRHVVLLNQRFQKARAPLQLRPPVLRGLHSFRIQLNLSSSVHRVTQLNA
jgi:hypothetical protein